MTTTTIREMMTIAHISEVVGRASEMWARLALLSSGWTVATTDTEEPFDVVARDPVNRRWATFQVKTIRQRSDRGGEYVIYAKKNNGEPYTQTDADYIIGVLQGDEDTLPAVYMLENRGIGEYWATEQRAGKRWHKLPLDLQRGYYESTDGGIACPA